VLITTSTGEALAPGTSSNVELAFWNDLAGLYVRPGTVFDLRYPTRIVARGEGQEVHPF